MRTRSSDKYNRSGRTHDSGSFSSPGKPRRKTAGISVSARPAQRRSVPANTGRIEAGKTLRTQAGSARSKRKSTGTGTNAPKEVPNTPLKTQVASPPTPRNTPKTNERNSRSTSILYVEVPSRRPSHSRDSCSQSALVQTGSSLQNLALNVTTTPHIQIRPRESISMPQPFVGLLTPDTSTDEVEQVLTAEPETPASPSPLQPLRVGDVSLDSGMDDSEVLEQLDTSYRDTSDSEEQEGVAHTTLNVPNHGLDLEMSDSVLETFDVTELCQSLQYVPFEYNGIKLEVSGNVASVLEAMKQTLDLHETARHKAEALLIEEIKKRTVAEDTIAKVMLDNKRLAETSYHMMTSIFNSAARDVMNQWAAGISEPWNGLRFVRPTEDAYPTPNPSQESAGSSTGTTAGTHDNSHPP